MNTSIAMKKCAAILIVILLLFSGAALRAEASQPLPSGAGATPIALPYLMSGEKINLDSISLDFDFTKNADWQMDQTLTQTLTLSNPSDETQKVRIAVPDYNG